ncbi:MAG: hypothetical protein KIT00_04575 [Rhodospirillales bacterium]|nr:hypothetical protein [Rhodospirillales bacterium]
MTISILDVAEAELEEAFAFYEAEKPGLGSSFAREFLITVDRIVELR